jgi:DeoR family transcriptional regulator, fructose operon transcriptional repressor
MLIEERLIEIENIIKKKKFCSIIELSEKFSISKATIRRDLQILSDKNVLRLVRGGATSLVTGTALEPVYSIKKDVNHEEKVRIGKSAAKLVNDGETIIIDSGSTLVEMSLALKDRKNITIATNDILIANGLLDSHDINLTVIGGDIRKNYNTLYGYIALLALEHINADKVFLGVDAIDCYKGCMITNTEEVILKKAMMQAAKERIIICDHSKFTNVAFLKLCQINEIDRIITGRELDNKIYESFVEEGVNIELV